MMQMVDTLSKKLNSLEVMLKLLIIGNDEGAAEVDLLADKLLSLNKLVKFKGVKRHYLAEVYNICYAIKVLIRCIVLIGSAMMFSDMNYIAVCSNIPGMTISIDNVTLSPTAGECDELITPSMCLFLLRDAASKRTTKSLKSQDSDDAHGDDLERSSDSDGDLGKKKRKRKRGKRG